jgi:hypothetical protein
MRRALGLDLHRNVRRPLHSTVAFVATTVAAALLLAALLPGAASADRRGGWVLLGERSVTDARDHDTIAVTAARGDFRRLQLRVLDRAVQFHAVKVHFASGETQELELRDVIRAGGRSRAIDLEGRDRVIRSIELRYDAQSLGGRAARVRVYGLR